MYPNEECQTVGDYLAEREEQYRKHQVEADAFIKGLVWANMLLLTADLTGVAEFDFYGFKIHNPFKKEGQQNVPDALVSTVDPFKHYGHAFCQSHFVDAALCYLRSKMTKG